MKKRFTIIPAIAALTLTLSAYADKPHAKYACQSRDAIILLPIPTKDEHDVTEVSVQMSGVTTMATYVRDGLSQYWKFNKKGTTYIELTPDLQAKYFHDNSLSAMFRGELR